MRFVPGCALFFNLRESSLLEVFLIVTREEGEMYDSIIESLPIIRGLRRPRINKHTKKGSEIFNKFTRLGMLYSLYLTFTHVYDECGSQK